MDQIKNKMFTVNLNRMTIQLLVVLFLFLSASCDDDENEEVEEGLSSKYVTSLRIAVSEDETADYYLAVDDLMSGEITAEGQGTELIGWNYYGDFGGTYFAFGYDLNECIGFKEESGKLLQEGKFVFERMDMMSSLDDENFLAIGAPWGGGSFDCQLQVVNVEDIAIHKNVKHPIYESYDAEGEQLNAWPTGIFRDADKVFVSFYPLHGVSWATPTTDSAFVSVYSYPDLEYIKTIKDIRVGPIGYYGGSPAILENETGDHFTISGGSKVTGFTQVTKPSGILKINAGEDEFDANYHFDVEASGYKAISGAYAGNDLVVARVISTTLDEQASESSQWAAFGVSTPILNIAVLDLENETVTIVDDVPMHGGQYQTPYLVEDGKVYISVNDGSETYVYQVDAATATATKGAKIIGNQLQSIFAN
ncbi:DUF4374 domain-containing protein [Reichenbachiella sp.]|uniref:DUF4374 domain-containing protein n=1 Tax=Reichenbachiella sp. TaxID=2184521 RepID=UPI003B5ACF10